MIYRAEEGSIRLLVAGDAMPSRSLKPFAEPDYAALLQLCRGADLAFANLETTTGKFGIISAAYIFIAYQHLSFFID